MTKQNKKIIQVLFSFTQSRGLNWYCSAYNSGTRASYPAPAGQHSQCQLVMNIAIHRIAMSPVAQPERPPCRKHLSCRQDDKMEGATRAPNVEINNHDCMAKNTIGLQRSLTLSGQSRDISTRSASVKKQYNKWPWNKSEIVSP